MKLIHTLLFMLRADKLQEDIAMAEICLRSLEKSTYKDVIVYNQGALTNEQTENFLHVFNLNCTVIGSAFNVGIVAGRKACFEHVWNNLPEAAYISEIHLDMIFAPNWEDALVEYLGDNDEPVVSSGIVDKEGVLNFLDVPPVPLPTDSGSYGEFLTGLRRDIIVHGFTHPCVHKSAVFRAVGGYNTDFLKGKQCFEDDSILLGYYYYYGTNADWHPKVNYNTVAYHALAAQRLDLHDSIMPNYNGLVRQYGAMGQKHLAHLHRCPWHKNFFTQKYNEMLL